MIKYINKYCQKFKTIYIGYKEDIPCTIQYFINRQIDKEIEQGYIEHQYKKSNGQITKLNIGLNDLISITYIYDEFLEPNHVFQMHKTNEEELKLKYVPLELELN